jgi:hypothetical protein
LPAVPSMCKFPSADREDLEASQASVGRTSGPVRAPYFLVS